MSVRLAVLCFCLGLVLFQLPSFAQEEVPSALVIDDPVKVAADLIRAEQYEKATVILEALTQTEGTKDQFFYQQSMLLLATVKLRQNDLDGARDIYQELLANYPENATARIQLAGLFRQQGNHDLALFHLQLTDLDKLPDQLRGRITDYINWSERREGWSYRLNFALMPDTNINSATTDETVSIYGWEFDLSDDAQRTSGIGLQVGGGVAYSEAIGESSFIDAKLDGYYTFYPKKSGFDQGFAMLRVGPRHQIDNNNEISFYLQSYLQRFGGKTYSDSYGLETSYKKRFNQKQIAQFRFTHQIINNRFDQNRDGKRYIADVTYRQFLTERGYINLSGGFSRDDLKSAAISSNSYSAGAGFFYQFAQGINLFVNGHYTRAIFDDIWGVFGQKRKDHRKTLSVELTKRDFTVFGFAPVIGVILTDNKSNIDLFRYTRVRSTLSFSKVF